MSKSSRREVDIGTLLLFIVIDDFVFIKGEGEDRCVQAFVAKELPMTGRECGAKGEGEIRADTMLCETSEKMIEARF